MHICSLNNKNKHKKRFKGFLIDWTKLSVVAIYGAFSEISKSAPTQHHSLQRVNLLDWSWSLQDILKIEIIQYIESNNFDFKDCQIYRRFFVLHSQSGLTWLPWSMLMLLHVNKSFGQDGYRKQCTSELTPNEIVTYRAEKQIFRCFWAKSTEHLCCSKLESGNFRSWLVGAWSLHWMNSWPNYNTISVTVYRTNRAG